MKPRQMFFLFVCICGFAGIFYYALVQRGTLASLTSPGRFVDHRVVSLAGYLSVSQQQLEARSGHNKAATSSQGDRLSSVNQFGRRKQASDHNKNTSNINTTFNSDADLERYTISKPSREKLGRIAIENALDEKFLRNDERSLARIVDGDSPQMQLGGKVFKKSGKLVKRLPNVIIVGVKKGGTRALLEILKLHPQVCACGPEIHYFDRYSFKGLKWYNDRMPLCYENEVSVEKTPSYFVTSGVPKDVFAYSKLLNSTLRLLLIVRDPTTRAISDYTQTQYKSKHRKTSTFEERALKRTVNDTKVVDERWGAIKIGVYSRHLKRWLQYFPQKQIYTVSGENLITKPYEEIKKVERFLELPSFIKRKHFVYNDTKGFYCFDRALSYNPNVAELPGGETTPLRCLGTTKGRSHAKISTKTEEIVRAYYRPFNEELYRMVGRNFGWK